MVSRARLDVEAVDARGERQVLHRAELLEERRIDADPVDQALDLQLVAHDVVAEHLDASGVEGQESGDEADERRLAGPVRAQHAVDVAALEPHRHVHDRLDGHLVSSHGERLAHVVDQEGGGLDRRQGRGRRAVSDCGRVHGGLHCSWQRRGKPSRTGRRDRRHTTKPRADGPRLPVSVSGGDAGETYLRVRPAGMRTSTLPWACEQRAAVFIRWPRVAEFDAAVHLWCRRSAAEPILCRCIRARQSGQAGLP